MASGFTQSITQGSEEGFDTWCSPCYEDGLSKEGKKYCMDCDMYYCEQCLKTHNRIPSSREHQIVDKSGLNTGSTRTALPTERCVIHHGKLVDMFCADHDTVCCSACIAVKHRMCVKIEYIPDVAKGIKDSPEYRSIKDGLGKVLSQLKEEKTKRRENLSSLEQDKATVAKQINKLEEDLKQTISKMAENARAELQTKQDDIGKSLEKQISHLEKMIALITSGEEKLKQCNDVELFVNAKEGKNIIKDGQKMLSDMSKTKQNFSFSFHPNDELQQLARSQNSLGTLRLNDEKCKETSVEVRGYVAQLYGKYKVNEKDCQVSALCVFDDTELLVFNNTTFLKRLNMTDFKVVDQLQMDDISYSVCNVGFQEVAVALYNIMKIQFVSVAGTLTPTGSFSTDHLCFGLAFNETTGELFVSNNGNQVKVYDKKGNTIKSYVNDGTGKPMFSKARLIAYSDDSNTIFISDYYKGLLAMDKSLSLQWVFSDSELQHASGLCVLPGGVTLVSAYYSKNVIQVDKQGKKVGTLLSTGDNLKHIWALAYNRKLSTLIVGQNSNEIFVYKLTPK